MNSSSKLSTSSVLQNSFFFQEAKPDTTYFSVDCFHFSERGHADMAAAMWNNMVSLAKAEPFLPYFAAAWSWWCTWLENHFLCLQLEPVGKKETHNDFVNARNTIKCPTEVRSSRWPKCDISVQLCASTGTIVKKNWWPWQLCVPGASLHLHNGEQLSSVSHTKHRQHCSSMAGCCVGCGRPPGWLSGDLAPPLLH